MNRSAVLRLVAGFAAVLAITGGIYFVRSHSVTNPDYPSGRPGIEVVVDIPEGATGSAIATVLASKGIVKSSAAFFSIAVSDSRSSHIAPGSHRLNTHLSAREALNQLLDTKRITNLIRVAEGVWTDEIIAAMEKVGFSKGDVQAALGRIHRPPGYSGNEGIFFPAQYSFGSDATALAALQTMVDRFALEVKGSGIDQGGDGFTSMELLTIASIVQAEGDTADFPKISRVIRNRLKVGMPLQMDSTVNYVTRTRGQIFLSTQATHIASAYNTYLHYGLPPGPIGNPGRAALDAALNPSSGDWIYFITVKPGDTRFTDSNAQFLTWKSEYEKNLSAGVFGKKP